MAYCISWIEETPVWSGTDPETGEDIFDKEERRASYPSVPADRMEELRADAMSRTCDPDSVTVEEVPDPEPAPGQEDVWAELDAAYQEGVNAAYDQ